MNLLDQPNTLPAEGLMALEMIIESEKRKQTKPYQKAPATVVAVRLPILDFGPSRQQLTMRREGKYHNRAAQSVQIISHAGRGITDRVGDKNPRAEKSNPVQHQ